MTIRLVVTDDQPVPQVTDPDGNLWAWDADLHTLRNLSVDAPPSPDQAVRNFQTAEARYRWQVFVNDALFTQGCHPALADVRVSLRSILLMIFGRPWEGQKVQYNCFDFADQVWMDPSTGMKLPPEWPEGGVLNAEVQVKGGFGTL